MERWKFAIDNEKLINLVLSGKKTATCYLYNKDECNDEKESILIDDNNFDVCKIETIEIKIIKFKDVTWKLAKLEGEFTNLKDWQESHCKFFKEIYEDFNKNSLIVFEIFNVIENYSKIK